MPAYCLMRASLSIAHESDVRRFFLLVGTSLIILVFFALDLSASSFRCGNQIVEAGDNKLEVLQKCGQPDLREVVRTDGQIVEKWYYDCGARRFIRILTFSGGVLQVVETGDYGTGPQRCL